MTTSHPFGAECISKVLHRISFVGMIYCDYAHRRSLVFSAAIEVYTRESFTLAYQRFYEQMATRLSVDAARDRHQCSLVFPEVANFTHSLRRGYLAARRRGYLLLRNEKIRDVIDTIGKKSVLLHTDQVAASARR